MTSALSQRPGAAGARRTLIAGLVGLALLAGYALAVPVAVAAATEIDLTVTITSVKVLGEDLEGVGRSTADLYAGFSVGNSQRRDCGTFGDHEHDKEEIRPSDWVCTTHLSIQGVVGSSNVDIEIWDHDDCDDPFCSNTGVTESDDDQADASPGSNRGISLSVDLTTGRWTAAGGTTDVTWPRNCGEGSGGIAVRVCFDISIDSASGDADGDALLDGWERNGYNADGDTTIDLDLPTMGAQPMRKDLLLELDCLVAGPGHSHCPPQLVVQDVVQAFANAQVGNPDGSSGIELHVDVGDIYGQALNVATNVARTPGGAATGTFGNYGSTTSIPEMGLTILDFDGATGSAGVDIKTVRAANMDAKRFLVMRYGVFGHQTNARQAVGDCTSGLALNDIFMVTLGGVDSSTPANPCWTVPAGGTQSIGSRTEQAGTFLHEFGHTLSLGHGGGDGDNNKPNYLSVMNYSFQMCTVPAQPLIDQRGGCNFSVIDLDDLNETALDECKGLGDGLPAVNWNGDGNFSGPFLDGPSCPAPNNPGVQFNVNDDTSTDTDGDGNQSGSEPDRFSTLAGYDDWAKLQYKLQSNGGGAGAAGGYVEATPEIIEHAQALVAEMYRPAPAVEKTGPADAEPGDTLNYSLTATNTFADGEVANSAAFSVVLTDTKPDASTVTFELGTIGAGGSATRSTSYLVPCDTADGATLTNSVALAARDFLGTAFAASDAVTTIIHAPVVTLDKTATGSVNAGEAITYTLTYENTGSGGATNVTITDVLPAGVYYSVALDLGAGPQPTSVTRNADGTTTLTWSIGSVAAGTAASSIVYTARSTLLFLGGETLTNAANLTFENGNGCAFESDTQTASTSVTVVPPTRNPLSHGYWRNHSQDWTAELLARIQATDQRWDGADGSTPDGSLSAAEAAAVQAPSGNGDRILNQQTIATLFNLASRRINAATGINSEIAGSLGLVNVRDAVVYAQGTLDAPLSKATRTRYSNATEVLDRINNNQNLVF